VNKLSELIYLDNWDLKHSRKNPTFKLYITSQIEKFPLNDLFGYERLWPTRPQIEIMNHLNITSNLEEADYALVPHDWRLIRNEKAYVEYLNNLSISIPILILNLGDKTTRCSLNNTLELRTHLWPWENDFRKIIIPYPTDGKNFTIRNWKKDPTISFMGYAPKLGPRSLLGKNPKGILKPIKSSVFLIRHISIIKLSRLENLFDTRITKRTEFTAYSSNPNLMQFTEEYNRVLAESDYVLCPRGESNISIRFYETLSSGATPILINTLGGLPKLSQGRNWENYILELDLFSNWKSKIKMDWENLKFEQNYINRQFSNYNLFKEEININSYLKKLFENYML
jgi:hypothetical protein